ncbi:MAG: hypothetical protein A2Y03_11340 [Omnitrophica WOR_2 bacterium GWF2_38_59]|nr:MAG: hypothetical protein A2Y06_05600 [Omnitrophica WOR_2 bacterium GWA2_37_7]OGX25271.1 MAG: hypothetical protein A2Y03_11340 [Omnitrophica WOR_2 bacterium GWF2_38_59]OGX47943.1 MAG: hypothetical protein A2243_01195 [Omnitrophica WOR_2 bacterium RIFOXYA2_FULL_38_17]OGX52409.1 MAG: hypothetical protein A2267_03925 [Omnitrophica WOR_2 bacterium RIFOXYA12_FULL_38_10]OGX56280.1 MAG: hypothetical protein A2447_08515 [Omnitrophica WOR_2 bacterium RIFOXYC2_FULL_38_12]OGX60215.1 MAG: hypothetical 
MVADSGIFVNKKGRLGEILLNRKMVVRKQLSRALNIQKKDKRFIGEILTTLGFVSEKDVVAALSAQCKLPYIAIDQYDIKQEVLNIIPRQIAFKYCVVPLDCVGNILSIAMSNPLDFSVLQELKQDTSCEIVPFISTRMEIDHALNNLYGGN